MSLLLNYEELFEPYTGDGYKLERVLGYLKRFAQKHSVSDANLELALNEVFSEVADGKEFSKTKCRCGCGIDKSATDLIHYIQARMLQISSEQQASALDLMRKRYALVIESQMKRISDFDKQYIKMNRPPISERSPVLRTIKRVWKWLWTSSQ